MALTGVNAGSAGKWSKQFNEMRNTQGNKPKVSSFEFISTIVKGLLQHFSALLVTPKLNWAWLLTRQRNKTTRDDGVLSSSLVSHFCFCRHIASPGETWNNTSCTCKKETTINGPYFAKTEHNDATNLTEFPWVAPVEAPTASFLDVEGPTRNSVPELYGTQRTFFSGRLTGSPEESNTKTQKPHDAIFMYRRALSTSLCEIWMATILFLQTEANEI